MSEVLKFRRGLSQNLKGLAVNPGSVYITTDERAMYVDIPAGVNYKGEQEEAKRIRIGNFVEYTDLNELAKANFYSTEALYLIQNYNDVENSYALLKYKGQGATGAEFVHLNSTSSIGAQLAALEERVDLVEGDIGSLKNRMDDVEGKLAEIQPIVGDHEDRIKSLEESVEDIITVRLPKIIEDCEEAIQEVRVDLEGQIGAKADKSYVDENFALKVNVYTKDEADSLFFEESKLEGTLAPYAKTTDVNTIVGELQTDIAGKVAQDDFDDLAGQVQRIDGKLAGIETTVTTYVQTTAQNIVDAKVGWTEDTTVKSYVDGKFEDSTDYTDTKIGDLGDSSNVVTFINGKVSELQGEIDNVEERVGIVENEKLDKSTYQEDQTALNSELEGIKTSITNLESTASQTYATKGELSAAQTTLQNGIDSNAGEIGSLKEKVQNLESKDITLENTIAEVRQELNTALNVADAMTYKGTVGDVDDLPDGTGDEKVNGGDTYVASNGFTLNDKQVHAGDLIIANADQGENTTYTGGWSIVDTGYIESHENALAVLDNTVSLTSYIGETLGSATFAGDYNTLEGGINVSTTGNTINFEMCWGEF